MVRIHARLPPSSLKRHPRHRHDSDITFITADYRDRIGTIQSIPTIEAEYRSYDEAGAAAMNPSDPLLATSEAGRAFGPSVATTAEARALVSFTRAHAYEAGTGEVAHLHSDIAGLSAEIATDALVANLESLKR